MFSEKHIHVIYVTVEMSLLKLSDDAAEIRQEYGKLRRKADFHLGEDEWATLIWVPTTLIGVLTIYLLSQSLTITIWLGVFFAWIPAVVIAYIFYYSLEWFGVIRILDEAYEKRKKTRPWFQRYELLKSEVERLDTIHKAEQESIRAAMNKIESDSKPIRRRVSELDSYFRQKKKWYSYYKKDDDELKSYAQSFPKFLKRIDEATEGRTLDLDLQREKSSIQSTIRRSHAQCEALLRKLEAMKVWVAPNRVGAGQRIDRVERDRDETPDESNQTSLPLFPTPRSPRTRTGNARTRTGGLVEVPPPPPPVVRVLAHEAIKLPKRSKEEYQRLVRNRQDIGRSGELLALEYERKRVTDAEGILAAKRVVHVAETSDSLGYDISSVVNGTEVFIEVKTTTGRFWTDFFLTANEFAKMEKYKERYWIYRVHALDKETGEGLISIFRGMEKISETFSFEPRVYISKPRESENANP